MACRENAVRRQNSQECLFSAALATLQVYGRHQEPTTAKVGSIYRQFFGPCVQRTSILFGSALRPFANCASTVCVVLLIHSTHVPVGCLSSWVSVHVDSLLDSDDDEDRSAPAFLMSVVCLMLPKIFLNILLWATRKTCCLSLVTVHAPLAYNTQDVTTASKSFRRWRKEYALLQSTALCIANFFHPFAIRLAISVSWKEAKQTFLPRYSTSCVYGTIWICMSHTWTCFCASTPLLRATFEKILVLSACRRNATSAAAR